jgi:hypothetical protein
MRSFLGVASAICWARAGGFSSPLAVSFSQRVSSKKGVKIKSSCFIGSKKESANDRAVSKFE